MFATVAPHFDGVGQPRCFLDDVDDVVLDGCCYRIFSLREILSPAWLIEGSLEVKLPTIWTDEKQSREEAERRERLEERRSEEKESEERRCRCAKR